MDRGTVGDAAGHASQRLTAVPCRYAKLKTARPFNTRGAIGCRAIFQSQYWWNQGTGESLLDMFIRRIMTALAATALVCGGSTLAAAQVAPPKAAKAAPKVEAK